MANVPLSEQYSQGGSLSALYSKMTQGEAFIVIPVPKDREPDNDTPVATPNSNRRNNIGGATKIGTGVVMGIGLYEVGK